MKSKKTREKGKLKLSRIFLELKQGERVSIVRELAEKGNFLDKIQGKTGIIKGKRGKSYIVKITIGNKDKEFIIKPVHLKKLK